MVLWYHYLLVGLASSPARRQIRCKAQWKEQRTHISLPTNSTHVPIHPISSFHFSFILSYGSRMHVLCPRRRRIPPQMRTNTSTMKFTKTTLVSALSALALGSASNDHADLAKKFEEMSAKMATFEAMSAEITALKETVNRLSADGAKAAGGKIRRVLADEYDDDVSEMRKGGAGKKAGGSRMGSRGSKKTSSWKTTNYCKKSVFYGLDYVSTAIVDVDVTAGKPGLYDFSFNLKKNLEDKDTIGIAHGLTVFDLSDNYHHTTGDYLFKDADGIGEGEVTWTDINEDYEGIKNKNNTFGGDSEYAILGGHGDFKCATGWLDQLEEDIKFEADGTYDRSESTWKVTMYTCGVCEEA